MPSQTTNVAKSGLLNKLGKRLVKAAAKHQHDDVEFNTFGDLPSGMSGVAQLTDCEFKVIKEGKKNAGEYMFYAAGVVVDPTQFKDKEGNTHRVVGLRTSIMRTLADREVKTGPNAGKKVSLEDEVAWVQNEMKKLGADPGSLSGDKLEATAAALVQAAPFFKFRTWGGPTEEYPDGRVNHSWEGATDFTPKNAGMVNDTTATPSANGHAQAPAATTTGADDAGGYSDSGDVDSLVEEAGSDKAAQQKLVDFALKAGWTQEEVDDATDWAAVGYMVKNPKSGDATKTDDQDVKKDPGQGDVVSYKGPKDKKASKWEVTKVFAKTRQANLKSLVDPKKTAEKVSMDDLTA